MAAPEFLLDTGVVLHATRQASPVAAALDRQFGLSTSRFSPAVCEVSIGELRAFALAWGDRRKALLDAQIRKLVVMPISLPGVHERYAQVSSGMRAAGRPVDQNDMWIASTALVTGFTVLSVDRDFLLLREVCQVKVCVVDNRTGALIS